MNSKSIILFFILLILTYLLWKFLKSYITIEGMTANTLNLVVTLKNETQKSSTIDDLIKSTKNDETNDNQNDETNVIGNGIPSNYEYHITSIYNLDPSDLQNNIPVISENIPTNVNLSKIMTNNYSSITNSFIIISPKTKNTFPNRFEIKIENNIYDNNCQIDLWGNSPTNYNKKRPVGNSNTIIHPDNLDSYFQTQKDIELFTYNKKVFSSCFNDSNESEDSCIIGDLDVKNRILNIIETGSIYDNNGIKIGNVSQNKSTQTNSIENIIINIEKADNITGLLLYLGNPIKM